MTPKAIVPRSATSPAEPAAGALTPAQLARAKAYIAASHAERTKHAYSRAWAQFTAWCGANGHGALPATPETIAAWIVDLADGDHGRRPLARATINLYLSAVMQAHHSQGHVFDRKHPLIARTWRGTQDAAVEIVVPRSDMPTAARALRRWAAIAKLRPGEPVFRAINKGGAIAAERLTDRSVSRIVKVRLRQLAIASGRSAVDADK